jgi:adenylyltransferase/sulfurtransferase
MIAIRLPVTLANLLDIGESLTSEGATVGEALKALAAGHPDLRSHFFNASGQLKDHPWSYFRNGDQVDGAAPLAEGDEIEIVAGMSGGLGDADLEPEEVRYYARHLTLPEVGRAGQLKLKSARVLLVGAGGLGSPVALYLAAAGIGHLTVVDPDVVETSNLHRQVAHDVTTLGQPKARSAKARMADINPYITIEAIEGSVDEDSADALIAGSDLVIDGSDNFATRMIVNRVSRAHGKPLVFGAVYQFHGHVSVFNSGPDSPCYQCLFPKPPEGDLAPNCAAGGVLGVVPGIVGLWQAAEAVKLILGLGAPLAGRLMVIDVLRGSSRELRFARKPGCPACSGSAPAGEEAQGGCAVAAPAALPEADQTLAPSTFKDAIAADGATLVDVREPGELEVCRLPGAVNIPLRKLPQRLGELDRDGAYLLFCRSGGRSGSAVRLMLEAGFGNVRHLEGGLLGWSREVDPGMVVV